MIPQEQPSLKDSKWVATRLNITPQAVTRKARLGEIPAIRLGGLWRFDEHAISAHIQNNTHGVKDAQLKN